MTKRPPIIRTWSDAIIADNFAGGGGAASGIEAELRSLDEESRLLPGERVDFKAAGKELRRRTR